MVKKIVLSGGGSGGHITPLLAVAHDIRKLENDVELHYIGERGGKFGHIAVDSGLFDECHFIFAGKIRRYHNEPLLTRLMDYKTHFLNLRDLIRLLLGTLQALVLLVRLKPQSTFLKGGFVCVPVSIGAKFSGSTIITHDSDALPGLSNRFAAKFARYNTTAMPTKHYSYPESRALFVGLPVSEKYRPFTEKESLAVKQEYGIKPTDKVMLVTGGSLGAQRLNHWVYQSFRDLLKKHKDLFLIIIVGKNNMKDFAKFEFTEAEREHIYAEEFTDRLHDFAGICDFAVIRAGATTIAEFAAAKKPLILVPNPELTGGHQLKNSAVYKETSSVLVVNEHGLKKDVNALTENIDRLLNDPNLRRSLSDNLNSSLPKGSASERLAKLILGSGEGE